MLALVKWYNIKREREALVKYQDPGEGSSSSNVEVEVADKIMLDVSY